MAQILNNITKVEFIDSSLLKTIKVINGIGVLLNGWRDFKKLDTVGLASAENGSKVVKKNTVYTVKLKAELAQHFEPGCRHLCYRLTTASGRRFLLGTFTEPFVMSTVTTLFPGNVTDKSVTVLNAEYANTHGLLALLD